MEHYRLLYAHVQGYFFHKLFCTWWGRSVIESSWGEILILHVAQRSKQNKTNTNAKVDRGKQLQCWRSCSCCRYVSSRRMWRHAMWQRAWCLHPVVSLEKAPARSFLLNLRKGGQSQVNTSKGGYKTLHWCWSKNRWRTWTIDVSLPVSLLGQRSVICSSEWPYLISHRAYYCSFICLCLWTHCFLGGCFCTLCSSCIPS